MSQIKKQEKNIRCITYSQAVSQNKLYKGGSLFGQRQLFRDKEHLQGSQFLREEERFEESQLLEEGGLFREVHDVWKDKTLTTGSTIGVINSRGHPT